MDGIAVGSFVHSPTSSTNYQYNVPVYVNNSVPSGNHDVSIYPVNTGNSVLMLFDYLVYTTDTDLVTTSGSVSQSTSATSSISSSGTAGMTSGSTSQSMTTTTSPSSSKIPGADSRPKNSLNTAIIGGAVGGAASLALVVAFLLCYRRHKRRQDKHIYSLEETMLEPPVSPVFAPSPVPFEDYTPTQVSESQTRSKAMLLRPPDRPTSPPSTTSDSAGLVEQVELLRDEVSRLRDLHNYSLSAIGSESEPQPPPKYES
ncbi:hypothetical protein JVU11DRAFT_12099 [Chiua virens]|nr:hypothetical protein JVU11DRAFT_12099 [Chiua virens]